MDTELLRTFIEITRTRHFGRAAANLYLTQSAVSARMRLLEETLGVRLLTRERNDIQLTPAGRTLLGHANEIVNRWTQARQAVAIQDEGRVAIKAATIATVADVLLEDWLKALGQSDMNVALGVEISDEVTIGRQFDEGSIDLALLFEASNDQRLRSTKLTPLTLMLVGKDPDVDFTGALDPKYIYVGWGSWFDLVHAKHFPNYLPGPLSVPSPMLAANLIRHDGGSAYLPSAPHQDLYPVGGAPTIERTMYAVYPADSDRRGTIETLIGLVG